MNGVINYIKTKDYIKILLAMLLALLMLYLGYVVMRLLRPDFVSGNFFNALGLWDTGAFKEIALFGYDKKFIHTIPGEEGYASWAFFPLMPLIVRFFYIITFKSLNINLIGTFVNMGIYYAFLLVMLKYMRFKKINLNLKIFILLFVFNPYSYYFFIMYSESLYMLLLLSCCFLIEKNKLLYAGIAGMLLTATRSTGFLIYIPLLYKIFILNYKKDKNIFLSLSGTFKNVLFNLEHMLAIFLVPAGICLYMNHLYFVTGDAVAFLSVQTAWGRADGFFLVNLVNGLVNPSLNIIVGNRTQAVICLICLALAASMFLRKKYLYGTFCLVSLIIPMSSGLCSMQRFALGTVFMLLFIYEECVNLNYKLKNKTTAVLKYPAAALYLFAVALFWAGWYISPLMFGVLYF